MFLPTGNVTDFDGEVAKRLAPIVRLKEGRQLKAAKKAALQNHNTLGAQYGSRLRGPSPADQRITGGISGGYAREARTRGDVYQARANRAITNRGYARNYERGNEAYGASNALQRRAAGIRREYGP